jgi:hypothetical protein
MSHATGCPFQVHPNKRSAIVPSADHIALSVDASDIGYEVFSIAAALPKIGKPTDTAWLPCKVFQGEG